MILTAKIKLCPDDNQRLLLERTLADCNAACEQISNVAWTEKCFNQFNLHKIIYPQREILVPILGSQAVVRAIAKVSASYRANRKSIHHFSSRGSFPFDARMITFDLASQIASIWTIQGRQRIRFVCGTRQSLLLSGKICESKLKISNNQFYLLVSCKVEEAPQLSANDSLGIDLGIINIAVDSDGTFYGSDVNLRAKRKQYRRLRTELQSKNTKSSRRKLRKIGHREARFVRDINHCISKCIVRCAEGTRRNIVLEDLKNIRRAPAKKTHRTELNNWGFFDLRNKIEYKAKLVGVSVIVIHPEYTSQTCSACNHIATQNRQGEKFLCQRCGHEMHADHNAAINISKRAILSTGLMSANLGTSLGL